MPRLYYIGKVYSNGVEQEYLTTPGNLEFVAGQVAFSVLTGAKGLTAKVFSSEDPETPVLKIERA